MKTLLSYFHPKMPINLVYMLQQVEYEPNKFLSWVFRLPNLDRVAYRKKLVWTKKALCLVIFGYLLWVLAIANSILCLIITKNILWAGIGSILLSPISVIIGLYIVTGLAWIVVEGPRRRMMINRSKMIFAEHPAVKIAILGSYGKTTMKELLNTVLSEGNKKVAATPGNKNVALSHARFAAKLDGDEDVLLIEYGEGEPGDIAKFARTTKPNYAIITGLAPNHLDKYKTFEAVKKDLYSIKDFIDPENVYDLPDFKDAKFSNVKLDVSGMEFSVNLNGNKLQLKTELIGRHLLGPLSIAIDLARRLGLKDDEIKSGVSKTKPYEHRLQPRSLHGAWIIDDTYNGSLEGFRAGLKLLSELEAKKKIYVTPGLVDQGEETDKVHKEIGELITKASPDKVVLMENSATKIIKKSMNENGYKGEIEIRDDPLEFYTNIEHTLAAGDLVLMQNDWTDNYF